MNRFPLPWIVTVLVALAIAGCGGAPADETAVRSVRAVPVGSATLTEEIRTVGFLAPKDEVRLSFKLGGVVESIAVEEGQPIHRGQVLARLRATEAESAVAQVREAANKAARDLARGEQLLADGVATRENVDDLRTAARVAAAQLRSAEFNATFARIVAPSEGVVLQQLAEPDELVAPGQPVLVVGGTRQGWVVKVGVADREVVQLQTGMPAKLAIDAFPGRDFTGSVRTVARSADPATGTFQVEVALTETLPGFARGMVASVVLPRRPDAASAATLVLPNTALLEAGADSASVLVLRGDRVQRRQVRLGRIVNDRVEILAGLQAGEQVVVEGAAFVSDGERVTTRPRD